MKTITRWLIGGTFQTLLSVSLVLGAPPIINSGKPMLGFTMFAVAGGSAGVTSSVACKKILSSFRAKTILVKSFPEREDWSSLPILAFVDISEQQVVHACDSLREIIQNPWESDLVSGSNVINYIRAFSVVEND